MSAFPGTILMGAQSRLLPPELPFRFFAAAVVFHVAAWALVFWAAPVVPHYHGGPGPALAAVHAVTLGVLTTTAMGAAVQLLTVATGQPHRSLTPIRVMWWLYLPGVLALMYGFAAYDDVAMVAGGALTVLGLLVFAGVVVDLLRRTAALRHAMRYAWVGIASLVGLAGLGFALVADFHHGFLDNHMAVGLAHLVLAAYGFMGMLAVGFSHVLVPMFALSANPPAVPGHAAFGLLTGALVLAVGGLLAGVPFVAAVAAVLALVGVGLHVWSMLWCLKRGMRKRLGLSFVLARAAWVLLPASLVLGGLAAAGLLPPAGATLFGLVLVFGWLLTFLLGILQRIIPFLAAMNMSKSDRTPPRLSQLAEGWVLKVHAVCHAAALTAVAAGIVFGAPLAVRAGAAVGVVGALAFAWFTVAVARSYLAYHRGSGADAAPAA